MGVGGSTLATPLASSFATLVRVLGSSGGCLGFLAFSLLPFVFVTLTFFYVTFVLVVTKFPTVPAGDGTPEMILMGHCFPIFSVLLSFRLQHRATAMVAVRGMAGSALVIDRLTVKEWGCTCFRLNLIHGTQDTPNFTTTLDVVSGIFRPFPFATFRGRGATSTHVSRTAAGNSGSMGSSSTSMRTLRSVSCTGKGFSSLWRTSAHVE